MIYLDNAATSFPKPKEVYDMVDYVQRNTAVNIGRGSYKIANDAMKIVDEARLLMASLIGANSPEKIVFTPSATIAANEVIYGLMWDEYKTVYISPFEHNAIARPLQFMCKKYGINVIQLSFNKNTQALDAEQVELQFAKAPPDFVFLNQISNVTGAIIPVAKIAELAKKYNNSATIIVDGSQSAGVLDIDIDRDNIDFFIFAGHKNLFASWGIGGFAFRNQEKIKPILAGGTGSDSRNLSMGNTAPTCFEPASPNIIAISSLNASLKWLNKTSITVINEHKLKLIDRLISGLKEKSCRIYCPEGKKNHSGVVSFNVDGYSADEVGAILNQDFDIAVRTGFHCAPYIHDFLGTVQTGGTVRVSPSYFNTINDIDSLLSAIDEL